MNPEKATRKHSLPILLLITAIFIVLNVCFKFLHSNLHINLFTEIPLFILGPFGIIYLSRSIWFDALMFMSCLYCPLIYFFITSKHKAGIFFATLIIWLATSMYIFMSLL